MGVRLASIVLMAVLLVGSAAIWSPGSDPPGEPSTPTCTLRIRQAGGAWTSVTPVDRAKDPVAYYDYFSVSAHTEFVEAYVSKAFFYRNTATGKLYFFVHHNIDEGGSPDAIVDFDFAGLPAAVAVVLSDDPGEFRLGRAVEGQWHFFVNTDGGVLGEFPTGSDWSFTVSPTWGGPDPMRAWRFVDGSGIHEDLDMGKPLEVASVCNRPPTAVLGGPYVGPEGSSIRCMRSIGRPRSFRMNPSSCGGLTRGTKRRCPDAAAWRSSRASADMASRFQCSS